MIVCPLVFLGGFVDAVAGGGGLISLPAYLITGLPVHYAIGTNKLSSVMGTATATFRFAKNGYIPWKESICCAFVALVGSGLGANIALMISDYYFKILMLIILPLTALYVSRGKALITEKPPLSPTRTLVISVVVAFVIGMYDGFYGPGTGTFLILLLTALAHMSLNQANGTSKAINFSTNIAALAVYLVNGKVLLTLGLVAGAFSIVGNYLGTKLFDRGGSRIVKPLILVVLAVFFVRVVWELFF